MSERVQQTLAGFRPSANPQPESPPSSTDYMLMLKDLITSAQADISAVIDPKHLTDDTILQASQDIVQKTSIDQMTSLDFSHYAFFCTKAGQFYADLQASALESADIDSFTNFGRKAEIAKILQTTFLSAALNAEAAARVVSMKPEYK